MSKGCKTGGRQKGTPNKRTAITENIKDMELLPLATIMVYSLRLYQRVRNTTTVTVSYISSMIKRGIRYGESSTMADF